MNVVVRGLMAAGMAVYAAMHILQAIAPPEGAPGWASVLFGAAALAGLALAVGLILTATRDEAVWEVLAAALAVVSGAALIAALTVGFLGIQEESVRPEVMLVLLVEAIVVVAFIAGRLASDRANEVRGEDEVGSDPTTSSDVAKNSA